MHCNNPLIQVYYLECESKGTDIHCNDPLISDVVTIWNVRVRALTFIATIH